MKKPHHLEITDRMPADELRERINVIFPSGDKASMIATWLEVDRSTVFLWLKEGMPLSYKKQLDDLSLIREKAIRESRT